VSGVVIEAATPDDASQAAELAAIKREEYEKYSPVFWRVAPDAQVIHEPFLAKCIADEDLFTSFAARDAGRLLGIAITAHKIFPPPFSTDLELSWLTDDFFVHDAEAWPTVGTRLLRETEGAAREGGASRLVVLTARRDRPKRQMLEGAGYARGASWWVHPLTPSDEEPPTLHTTEAVVGPAPPVYAPGGPTSLTLSLINPSEVATCDKWAAASGAILGIVPVRADAVEVEDALVAEGYEAASDWYVKKL
jgi:GNAT superfamily N-acetyltransferase